MQKITPNLWYDGKAKEAVDFYASVFPDTKIISTSYYPTEGLEEFQQNLAGKELTIEFELLGQRFIAINAGPEFKFNESVSFLISCKDQEEIDYFWNALIADGGNDSQCGWLKDKYGLSWQVIPEDMEEIIKKSGSFANLMKMRKIKIADL